MTSFERALREQIDAKYQREPTESNPLWRLVNDRLPIEECRAFYLGLRDSLAVFNRVLLGRLLEECPSAEARSELLPVIAVEFGPPLDAAHPEIFNRFLRSLGVPEAEVRESADLLEPTSACRAELEEIRSLSWCSLLARLLVGESQGPVVFPAIHEALRRNYGLTVGDTFYFAIHATHDKKDTEVILRLLSNEVKTKAQEDEVFAVINRTFDAGRYAMTGCRLEAVPRYRYVDYSSTSGASRRAESTVPPVMSSPKTPVKLSKTPSESIPARLRDDLDRERERLRRALSPWREGSERGAHAHPAVLHDILSRVWNAVHAWEFAVGPHLLQRCDDLEMRVHLWQAMHASYGMRGSDPAASVLFTELLTGVNESGPMQDHGLRIAAEAPEQLPLGERGFGELIVQMVADQLVAAESFSIIRRMLSDAPFRVSAPALRYFERAERDAAAVLDAELGIALVARYADAAGQEVFADRVRRAVQASPWLRLVDAEASSHEQKGGSPREPHDFERELRCLCDDVYVQPGAAENPMLRLIEGRLDITEAQRFWAGRWTRILVLSQHLLPALLRACPDLESRNDLWRSVSVEYGEGDHARSHPMLYARFLKALGLSEDAFPAQLDALKDAEARRLVAAVENASWLELLGGFLARETVGPKVFGSIADALRRSYGLSEQDVEWFTVHSVQDQDDADDVFELARRFGTTAEAQAAIRTALLRWFEGNPEYCCALAAPGVQFEQADRTEAAQ